MLGQRRQRWSRGRWLECAVRRDCSRSGVVGCGGGGRWWWWWWWWLRDGEVERATGGGFALLASLFSDPLAAAAGLWRTTVGRHECPTVHSCSGRHCWANPTMTASGEAAMRRSSKECRVGGRRRRGGDGSREQPRCVRRGGRRERRRKEDGGWEFSNFRRRLNVWGSTGAQGDWGCSWCQPLTLALAAAQLLERCARTLCVHLRPAGRLPWPSGKKGTHAAISGRNWPDGALAPR